jgi:mRNA interferase YafQ
MLDVRFENRFKKDFKIAQKRGYDMNKLETVITLLREQKPLPAQYRDHQLRGTYDMYRECHIEPDWLLIYRIFNDELILSLTRTGTHSDLFSR